MTYLGGTVNSSSATGGAANSNNALGAGTAGRLYANHVSLFICPSNDNLKVFSHLPTSCGSLQ